MTRANTEPMESNDCNPTGNRILLGLDDGEGESALSCQFTEVRVKVREPGYSELVPLAIIPLSVLIFIQVWFHGHVGFL